MKVCSEREQNTYIKFITDFVRESESFNKYFFIGLLAMLLIKYYIITYSLILALLTVTSVTVVN